MKSLYVSLTTILVCVPIALGNILPYTGNVAFDFGNHPTTDITDPIDDVGMPIYAPPDAIAGWEIERVVFYLSISSDALQIGIDAVGVAGDADGNGIDGVTEPWMSDNGGTDYPTLMHSESMGIALDFDLDGAYDHVTGVSAFDDLHKFCEFSGFPDLPFMAFGTEQPLHNGGRYYDPTMLSPDYELTVAGVSSLCDTSGDQVCFKFLAFGGSFQDDGVGEEFVNGTICVEDGTTTVYTQPEQLELSAYPNPFNPATRLVFSLVDPGQAKLTVYNLAGQAVRTIVEGDLASGVHEYLFDAGSLPSGLYFARLETASGCQTARMLLMK